MEEILHLRKKKKTKHETPKPGPKSDTLPVKQAVFVPPTSSLVILTPISQVKAEKPSKSSKSSSETPKVRKSTEKRASSNVTLSKHVNNPFAEKFFSAAQIKEIEDSTGIQCKRSYFTPTEDDTLRLAIDAFFEERGQSSSNLKHYIDTKTKMSPIENKDRSQFWRFLASKLENRAQGSVYRRVKRLSHEGFRVNGGWSQEDRDTLHRLVVQFGNNWKKIGEQLGRIPGDCRSYWQRVSDLYADSTEATSRPTRGDSWDSKDKFTLIMLCLDKHPGDRMTVAEIIASIEKRQNWPCLLEEYNKVANKPRTVDDIRLRWTKTLYKGLTKFVKNLPEHQEMDVSTVADRIARKSKTLHNTYSYEDDVELLEKLVAVEPAPNRLMDIPWNDVSNSSLVLKIRTVRSLKGRLLKLIKFFDHIEAEDDDQPFHVVLSQVHDALVKLPMPSPLYKTCMADPREALTPSIVQSDDYESSDLEEAPVKKSKLKSPVKQPLSASLVDSDSDQ